MVAVTTTRRRPKAFAWSYSKLKNYRSCPKRHYHVDVKRDVVEPESDQLMAGNFTHKVIAERIEKGTALPLTHTAILEDWANRILQGHPDAGTYAAATGGMILVEQKLAITKDFGPCGFFGKPPEPEPWFRGVGDVVKIRGPVAMVVDWKTGKVVEDSEQLFLMAACIFAHYPQVKRVRAMFVWLKEDAETIADYSRDDLPLGWSPLLPEVNALEAAYASETFPAKPGFLCKRWCPVTACKYNGE